MESVIDKLSEIETAASRIMESAVEETRRQDNAAEERTSTYDNDTDVLRLPEHWKLPNAPCRNRRIGNWNT